MNLSLAKFAVLLAAALPPVALFGAATGALVERHDQGRAERHPTAIGSTPTPASEAASRDFVSMRDGVQTTFRSPWGYSARYFVQPGWNRLMCVGTGQLFSAYSWQHTESTEQR